MSIMNVKILNSKIQIFKLTRLRYTHVNSTLQIVIYISYLCMLTSSDAIIYPRNNGSIQVNIHAKLCVIIHRSTCHTHNFLSYLWGLRGQARYLWSKCIRISFKYNGNSFLANRFIFNIITAAIAIAIFTIFTTCETFTI